jgi:protein-L-isoaspartate(D-aspartate) O-methyltransferase
MQDYSLARRAMIDSQLRPQGVTDGGVLAAMGALPRENYVPEAARSFAYFDRPLKLGVDRAMMPPAALGRLLSELAPRVGERALVVGAATGYSAALLSLIGLAVTATEEDAALAATARTMGVEISASDDGAPYDLILIDGAIEYIPEELVGRLVEGGRLGTALLDRGVSRLVVGRAASGRLGLRTIVDADVAPLPGFERARAFTF